jgi:hypothetical protein
MGARSERKKTAAEWRSGFAHRLTAFAEKEMPNFTHQGEDGAPKLKIAELWNSKVLPWLAAEVKALPQKKSEMIAVAKLFRDLLEKCP